MKTKTKTISEAQLAQRRANAAAQKARGCKAWVTISLEREVADRLRAYVAAGDGKTISDVIRSLLE